LLRLAVSGSFNAARLFGSRPSRSKVEALLSYGPDFQAIFRRAELPVEVPTKFQFLVNLKTAKALGITLSESLLLRADEVIE
jgi:hypothetical protein